MLQPLRLLLAISAFAAPSLAPRALAAPAVPSGFVDERIAYPLHFAACMTFLPDGRVLVTGQLESRISLVVPATGAISSVGTIDSVRITPEQGLFGIAVDPRWPASPYVYVHYAYSGAPRIHISRFTVSGDLDGTLGGTLALVPGSEYRVLVSLPDSTANHNGGQVHFGADSLLYVSVGDDLASCGAQSKSRLIGKILRLKVRLLPAGGGGPPALADITPATNPFVLDPNPHARLVWAYGLRNPYSFAIDRPTGHVAIADVGSAGQEELDLAISAGRNFGWPLYEGYQPRFPCQNADTTASGTTAPIAVYERTFTDAAVVCGGRYRPAGGPSDFPAEYDGSLFFSDVYHGFLRRLVPDGGGWRLADPVPGQPNATDWGTDFDGVTSYQLGPDGALWYSKYAEQYEGFTGEIRRIRWTGAPVSVPPAPGALARLEAPVPSPASGSTRLAWTLEQASQVAIDAYDVHGKRVRRIRQGFQPAGRHTTTWDLADEGGKAVRPGLYFLRLVTPVGHAVRSLVVVH